MSQTATASVPPAFFRTTAEPNRKGSLHATLAAPSSAPATPVRSQLADLVALSHHAKMEEATALPAASDTPTSTGAKEVPRKTATEKTILPPSTSAESAALQMATPKTPNLPDSTVAPKQSIVADQTLLATAVTANTASRHHPDREPLASRQEPATASVATAACRTPAKKEQAPLSADEVPALHRSEPLPPEPTSLLRSRAEAITDTAMNQAGTNPRFEAIIQRVERLQQMVQNFEQNLSTLAQQQGGTMTIELTPQALGRLTVNCDIKDGAMTLELVADSEGARSVLANHAQAIRDVVQNSGYSLAHLDVRARGEWADQRPAPFRQANGTRREKKNGRETTTTNALGAPVQPPSTNHPAHAVWLVA